jgi:hypothetical protein
VPQNYGKMVRLLIRSLEAFGESDQWPLEEGDDWPKFARANVPENFMKIRNLYWKAISTREAKCLKALLNLSEEDGIASEKPKGGISKSATRLGMERTISQIGINLYVFIPNVELAG